MRPYPLSCFAKGFLLVLATWIVFVLFLWLGGCATRGFDGNWSQGNLRDAAADGCPHQYHQWTTGPDGTQWLTGCWGSR
jgi:hypothetical protein